MGSGSEAKTCAVCGADCGDRPRVKDPKGRYYCKPCYEEARRHGLKRARAAVSEATPAEPEPHLEAEAGPAFGADLAADDPAGGSGMLDDLLGDVSEPAAPADPGAADAGGGACPGCGAPLGEGAVLCTSCGYDVQAGGQLETKKRRAKRAAGEGGGGGAVALLKSPLGVGALVLVVFGGLLAFGTTSEQAALAYFGVDGVFGFVVGITVLVFAFREGIGQGFLTLCVPFYVLYFIFAVCDNGYVRILFLASIVTRIAGFAMFSSTFMEMSAIP
ncbi:MAG: hypothetical protein ACYTG1_08865 [Planctomycetota bacterium]|jgi:hypothetical protein